MISKVIVLLISLLQIDSKFILSAEVIAKLKQFGSWLRVLNHNFSDTYSGSPCITFTTERRNDSVDVSLRHYDEMIRNVNQLVQQVKVDLPEEIMGLSRLAGSNCDVFDKCTSNASSQHLEATRAHADTVFSLYLDMLNWLLLIHRTRTASYAAPTYQCNRKRTSRLENLIEQIELNLSKEILGRLINLVCSFAIHEELMHGSGTKQGQITVLYQSPDLSAVNSSKIIEMLGNLENFEQKAVNCISTLIPQGCECAYMFNQTANRMVDFLDRTGIPLLDKIKIELKALQNKTEP